MNLRDLKYLVTVADLKHFGRAADACHVSQPTLSTQLAKLEDYLGVKLFERTSRAVEVTAVGAQIVAAARESLVHAERVTEIARAHRDPLSGPLRLGVLPTLAPYLMPWLLKPMAEHLPKAQVSVIEEPTARLVAGLLDHEIDAAFLATDVTHEPKLAEIALFHEPFWIACPRGHALARATRVTRKDLASAGLLLLSDDHCLRGQAMEACSYRSREPQQSLPDLRASSLETLLEFVAGGLGCTLLPALATRGAWAESGRVRLKPVDVSDASRRVALVFRASFTRRMLLENLAQLVRAGTPHDLVKVIAPVEA